MPSTIRIRNGHLCVYLASYMVMGVSINRSNDSFYQEFCFIRVCFNEVLLYVHFQLETNKDINFDGNGMG